MGTRGAVPNPTIDVNSVESLAQKLIDKENEADLELEPSDAASITPKTEDQMTIQMLAKRIADLENRGGAAGALETVWAQCISEGIQNTEVDDIVWAQVTRKWAKNPPESVWWNNVRMFKKGTMQAILEEGEISVDYKRGLSTNKYSKNRFKGRE